MQTETLVKEIFTYPENINEIFTEYFEDKNQNFIPEEEPYPLEKFKNKFEQPVLIGELESEDFNKIDFFTIKVKENLTERSSKRQQYEIAKDLLKLINSDAGIFIFYDREGNFRLSFVYAEYKGTKREFSHYKRYTYYVSKDQPNRTFIERLNLVKLKSIKEIKEAFSVEPLREEFFDEYIKTFNKLWKEISKQLEEKEDYLFLSKETAHQILNRLIFIYFIQRKKEWFPDILSNNLLIDYLWKEYKKFVQQNLSEKDTFFTKWLKTLFLFGFNRRYSEIEGRPELRILPENIKTLFAQLPYLNGGLFAENDLDKLDFNVPDTLIEEILEFLNRYNFTIIESLGLDKEVAVNPELIGTIYEKFVNLETTPELKEKYETEGKTKGIIYTQETEIEFMVKKAFVHYLQNNSNLPLDRIYSFVFDDIENFEIKSPEEYEILKNLVENVKIVDPACGSGSFLIGAVNLLHDLHKKLLKYSPEENPKEYAIRKHIIEENVYGVDVQDWAVKIAELRLWLFLIVESDLKREEILFEPLLPNLSFKVRQGDSLIEEIGNIDMSALRKDLREIPGKIKGKITKLKKEKLKYTKNEKGHLSKADIEKLELDIYRQLIEEKIHSIENEIKRLRNSIYEPIQTKGLFGDITEKQKKLFEKQKKEIERKIKQLEKEIEILKEARSKLEENKPFIWDIDFAEVFLDETKKGFDIVIGNPPYVRQEKIAPPLLNERDFTPSQWRNLKKSYKEKLQKMVENLYGKQFKPDGKADLYVYFYFKSLSLLNKNGSFAFITSNSWLDVGFGKALQEFLLRKVKLYSINDNQSKRSFKEADVNTVIIFTSSVSNNEKENLENTAKFVMWKKPFEDVITKENLIKIDSIDTKVENRLLTQLVENIVNTQDYRVFPIKQKDLYCDGVSVEKEKQKSISTDCTQLTYEGNKWGGKFLRAPDIFFTILKKGKDKLVRLGDIAEVKRGFTTGANEFFYVEDWTDKITEKELEKIENLNLKDISSIDDIKERGLKVIKPSKWGSNARDYKLFLIEEEFIKPVIKSPRELKTIVVREEDLKYKVFMCNKSKKELKDTSALDYIKWGEKQGFHKRPTCASRREWWRLFEQDISALDYPMVNYDRLIVSLNDMFYNDANLVGIYPNLEIANKIISLCISLNNSFCMIFWELNGISNLGEGAIKQNPIYFKKNLIFNPLLIGKKDVSIKVINILSKREIKSIFTELGFDPDKPIRQQEPNPLPDRKALDDIVFDALGLSSEERKEVYWAVAELVQNRLKKARSV